MVERDLAKVKTGVRFSLPALKSFSCRVKYNRDEPRSRGEMDIITAFEAVVPGSNPGGSTKMGFEECRETLFAFL